MQHEIDEWLEKLNQLQSVPFNYLVPDEQMLPLESIRFFWLDTLWVEALMDGAFSVGRVIEADNKHDGQQRLARNRYPQVTGFLIRFQMVEGWPDLKIEAYRGVAAVHITCHERNIERFPTGIAFDQ